MIRIASFLVVNLFWFSLSSCGQKQATVGSIRLYESDVFKKYWYTGQAEISSYHLQQSRYGEVREGEAVLIFVTEDFSKSKHVKLDDPGKAGNDKVSVLKMNFTKNFVTGIYPYSMMLSVFTPVQNPTTLKVTSSVQEWCGQVFCQMNLKGTRYQVAGYSYFEQEGDETFSIKQTWLEDELWNMIRLAPADLPVGSFEMIPGMFFSRLLHVKQMAHQAVGTRTENEDTVHYELRIKDMERTLVIRFRKEFPHNILGWEETFVEQGQIQKTTATLLKSLKTDYWTKNKNEHLPLRDSLGLLSPAKH
ncbi:MAG: hypothetical protein ACOYXA_02745 [Bacteroidota bacterium]